MKKILSATLLLAASTMPAWANEDLKKQVEQMATTYMECFGKQDPACIAALYTSDGFIANPAGAHKLTDYYGNAFKAGMNKLDAKTTQVQPVGDGAIAVGTFHVTGKDKDGKALDMAGTWTATYVKDGDKLKIRMLTAAPKPPPTN